MSIPYVNLLSYFEDEFENSSVTVPTPTSPTYLPISDAETEPFENEHMELEDASSEEDLLEDEDEEPLPAQVLTASLRNCDAVSRLHEHILETTSCKVAILSRSIPK
ncbi:hypothetical protein Tco_1492344 [Tanacetum coccineum]